MSEVRYKLACLDDEEGIREDFYQIFSNDFDISFFDDRQKIESVYKLIDEIDSNKIDALAIDYKLADKGWVSYNGDEVLRIMHERKLYFPVFLITSFVDDAMDTTDDAFLIFEKDNLKNQSNELIKRIKSSIKTYKRKINANEKKIEILEKKQTAQEGLTESEERELINLHFEMNLIDPKSNPITQEMLQTSKIKDLHKIVDLTRELLNSIRKEDK